MDKSEFMTALEKSFENDCNQLANLDIPYYQNIPNFEVSKKFQKKMSKLIERQRKPYFVLISTAGRRVASIIIIILVMLAASSLSVKSVRKTIKSFFVESNSDWVKVYTPPYHTTIKDVYEIENIPDGFELYQSNGNELHVFKEYRNNDTDKFIIFSQHSLPFRMSMDNEYSTIKGYTDENGQEYIIQEGKEVYYVFISWNNGDYVFYIYSNLDKNTVLDLCRHTKKK